MFTKVQTDAIALHFRELAKIFEKASASTTEEKSKRGRKPGAVSDDVRCAHQLVSGDRCKNRATHDKVCGKHTNA
jgi:hypothetical protein